MGQWNGGPWLTTGSMFGSDPARKDYFRMSSESKRADMKQ